MKFNKKNETIARIERTMNYKRQEVSNWKIKREISMSFFSFALFSLFFSFFFRIPLAYTVTCFASFTQSYAWHFHFVHLSQLNTFYIIVAAVFCLFASHQYTQLSQCFCICDKNTISKQKVFPCALTQLTGKHSIHIEQKNWKRTKYVHVQAVFSTAIVEEMQNTVDIMRSNR